jgi:hypothetical protein
MPRPSFAFHSIFPASFPSGRVSLDVLPAGLDEQSCKNEFKLAYKTILSSLLKSLTFDRIGYMPRPSHDHGSACVEGGGLVSSSAGRGGISQQMASLTAW